MYANLRVKQHTPEGDLAYEAMAFMVMATPDGDLVVHLDANSEGGRDPIPAGEHVLGLEDGTITIEPSF